MTLQPRPYLRKARLGPKSSQGDGYPHNLAFVKDLSKVGFHPDVTFLIGENGVGKSTLMEALAAKLGCNPEGGNRNFRFSTRPTHSDLHTDLVLERSHRFPSEIFFLRSESFYGMASYVEDTGYLGAYGGQSLHLRSHGEALLAVLEMKFKGGGLYLLDEPEAALSPSSQLRALAAFHRLVRADSQLIVATHSPILMAYPRSSIYRLSDSGVESQKYEQTEHYTVTRDFLNRHEQMLAILLDEEPRT